MTALKTTMISQRILKQLLYAMKKNFIRSFLSDTATPFYEMSTIVSNISDSMKA